jgi:hypothetical protein
MQPSAIGKGDERFTTSVVVDIETLRLDPDVIEAESLCVDPVRPRRLGLANPSGIGHAHASSGARTSPASTTPRGILSEQSLRGLTSRR